MLRLLLLLLFIVITIIMIIIIVVIITLFLLLFDIAVIFIIIADNDVWTLRRKSTIFANKTETYLQANLRQKKLIIT